VIILTRGNAVADNFPVRNPKAFKRNIPQVIPVKVFPNFFGGPVTCLASLSLLSWEIGAI